MIGRGRCVAVVFMATITIGAPPYAAGQTPARDATPDARPFIALGLRALDLGDWALALQQFQLAQMVTPASPELFLLLGVASEGVGGQDVAAIAWFRAYLAAAPRAPRAAEIRDRIARLDTRIEIVAREILADAADLLQMSGTVDTELTRKLAAAQATAGNLEEARKIVERLPDGPERAKGRRRLVEGTAARGDVAMALRVAQEIGDEEQRDEALLDVVDAQIRRRDWTAARATARGIRRRDNVATAAAMIVSGLGKARDRKGLQDAITQTPAAARTAEFLTAVTEAHLELGDIAAARRAALGIEAGSYRDARLETIAITQAERGDVAGARQTIATMHDADARVSTWMGVIEARAEHGDVAGARALFATYGALVPAERAYLRLATLARVDVAAAVEQVNRLGPGRQDALAHVAPVAVRRGDGAAARRLARDIEAPMRQRDTVADIAAILIRAGDLKSGFAALADIADPALRHDAEQGLRSCARPPAAAARPGVRDAVRASVEFVNALCTGEVGVPLRMADRSAASDLVGALRRVDAREPYVAASSLVNIVEQLLRALMKLREPLGRT